jgi:hypothetical protein
LKLFRAFSIQLASFDPPYNTGNEAWANKAGSERFKYFMVFDKNPLDGAYSVDNFLEMMKEL